MSGKWKHLFELSKRKGEIKPLYVNILLLFSLLHIKMFLLYFISVIWLWLFPPSASPHPTSLPLLLLPSLPHTSSTSRLSVAMNTESAGDSRCVGSPRRRAKNTHEAHAKCRHMPKQENPLSAAVPKHTHTHTHTRTRAQRIFTLINSDSRFPHLQSLK